MKSVEMDRDLERHELIINMVKKSLKGTKKKLQSYELALQTQPSLTAAKPQDFVEFDRLTDKILYGSKPPELPTLRKLKEDYQKAHPHPIFLSTGEVVLTKVEREKLEKDRLSRQISTKTLDGLQELRKSKQFGKTKMFGPEPAGEVLKTYRIIENYKERTRIVQRKEVIFDESNLIGKMTLDCPPLEKTDTGQIKMFNPSEGLYQLPFKSSERNHVSAEDIRQRKLRINAKTSTPIDRHELSPLRQRIMSRSLDQIDINAFSIRSPYSTLGRVSPISTIRSPSKVHIFPKGHPIDPIAAAQLKTSPAKDVGDDPSYFGDVNVEFYDGKFFFDPTVKALAKYCTRPQNHIQKDYTRGALVNWSDTPNLAADDATSVALSSGRLSLSTTESGSQRVREKKDLIEPQFIKKVLEAKKQKVGKDKVERKPVLKELSGDVIDLPHDIKDIKHALKRYYKDHDIYHPVRPATSRFLKENKPTTYMEIEKELLLPSNYDGETAYGDEAETMYMSFIEEQRKNQELEKRARVQTHVEEDDNSSVVETDDDDLSLSYLEELKLSGQLEHHQGLMAMLAGMGLKQNHRPSSSPTDTALPGENKGNQRGRSALNSPI